MRRIIVNRWNKRDGKNKTFLTCNGMLLSKIILLSLRSAMIMCIRYPQIRWIQLEYLWKEMKMKRLTKILALFLVIVFAFSPAVYATNTTYTYHSGNTEVRIKHDSLSEEKLLYLVQLLIEEEDYTDMQTYGIMCTLFGHKLSTGETEVVTHMVYDTYPCCELKQYIVTICERQNCNYSEVDLISTDRIGCCVP